MKHLFVLIILSISPALSARQLPGIYHIKTDPSKPVDEAQFSRLIIKSDSSFAYEYRTNKCCHLGYDLRGSWECRNDTLRLTDTTTNYHPDIYFVGKGWGPEKGISWMVWSGDLKPYTGGARVMCIMKNCRDTLYSVTDKEGRAFLPTINGSDERPEVGESNEVEVWVSYVNKKGILCSSNHFSHLTGHVNCVIEEDGGYHEQVIRTTLFRIDAHQLTFLSEHFNKNVQQIFKTLYGDFEGG